MNIQTIMDQSDPQPHYLKSIVRPAAELHDTGLLVEGKVLHVHLT